MARAKNATVVAEVNGESEGSPALVTSALPIDEVLTEQSLVPQHVVERQEKSKEIKPVAESKDPVKESKPEQSLQDKIKAANKKLADLETQKAELTKERDKLLEESYKQRVNIQPISEGEQLQKIAKLLTQSGHMDSNAIAINRLKKQVETLQGNTANKKPS